MKKLRTALYIFAYLSQYIMPIVLFGFVVPYFKGAMGPGVTGAGIVALCLALFITYRRIEKKIDESCKGFWHGFFLSIFPILMWVILGLGISRVLHFVNTLVDYWWIAFIFVILGRILTTVADAMAEKENKGDE